MKLLRNEKTDSYHEIEIERSFLWIKWRVKYRKVDEKVFRFKSPDYYYPIGLVEYINVEGLFKVKV